MITRETKDRARRLAARALKSAVLASADRLTGDNEEALVARLFEVAPGRLATDQELEAR